VSTTVLLKSDWSVGNHNLWPIKDNFVSRFTDVSDKLSKLTLPTSYYS